MMTETTLDTESFRTMINSNFNSDQLDSSVFRTTLPPSLLVNLSLILHSGVAERIHPAIKNKHFPSLNGCALFQLHKNNTIKTSALQII